MRGKRFADFTRERNDIAEFLKDMRNGFNNVDVKYYFGNLKAAGDSVKAKEIATKEANEKKIDYAVANLSGVKNVASNFGMKYNGKGPKPSAMRANELKDSIINSIAGVLGRDKADFLYSVVAFRGYVALKNSLAGLENQTPESLAESNKTLAAYRDHMVLNGINRKLIDMIDPPSNGTIMPIGKEEAKENEIILKTYFADKASKDFMTVAEKASNRAPMFDLDLNSGMAQRRDYFMSLLNPEDIHYLPIMKGVPKEGSTFCKMLKDSEKDVAADERLFDNQPSGIAYEASIDEDFNKVPTYDEIKAQGEAEWNLYLTEHPEPPVPDFVSITKNDPEIQKMAIPSTFQVGEDGHVEPKPYPSGFFAKVGFFFKRMFGEWSASDEYNRTVDEKRRPFAQKWKQKHDAWEEKTNSAKEKIDERVQSYAGKTPEELKQVYLAECEQAEKNSLITPEQLEAAEEKARNADFEKFVNEFEEDYAHEEDSVLQQLEEEFKAEHVDEPEAEIQTSQKQAVIDLEAID